MTSPSLFYLFITFLRVWSVSHRVQTGHILQAIHHGLAHWKVAAISRRGTANLRLTVRMDPCGRFPYMVYFRIWNGAPSRDGKLLCFLFFLFQ